MRILVTGGAGYIGSHTCIELIEAGHEIIVADNFSNSSPESLKRVSELTGKIFPVIELDFRNRNEIEALFKQFDIQGVIHFAALKAVGESVTHSLLYYQNNLISLLNLLDVMDDYQVRNIVFSSSATVYGAEGTSPLKETDQTGAVNPYGSTKLMAERIIKDLATSSERWRAVILRYFNPVGAHESGRIGEDPNGIPNNLMPYISQVATGKRAVLSVFGSDYPTRDGTGIRDYIHVTDLATGHVKALDYMLKNKGAHAFNLGTGKGFSVLEMVAAFEKASGRKVPYRFTDRRAGDIAVCYADPTKAEKELGWKTVKTIDDMCRDTWRWQRHNPDGYQQPAEVHKTERSGA
ncbi:UDP-glucose 4-epimerase [Jeotgalibacillus malaysiensis]|uniref:UDP-glucose 4-epimerase n=1 Tax=Jeotgalibacillus malaysiensis TaxID=1508404 RepID=A0A0B5AVT2_9BACL|nr:UDP-glucose 4-epimerase GalE [Jeotgalibacillus malaysiensis]AJD92713.1 UDP-glucose 4-epimerase [Jeotgalibacillus malaysiensis]